ncbi:hypothetical protein ACFPAF_00565 [Hymenobacter endophyticus]|uniref:Uncharacterized protein n=1 Tax=Hymenobacter endophyticus TaxID=3076335 RepID=A0ABU3TBX0_9BACT|nr:hypothetical protein [Hymenobacter endophyticus]MDU0368869.1 hypothetical protein [Hymenobacter endophyticus]
MKINRKFNTLTYDEYVHLIENHKKYTDFNTLGLFRAIMESTKLTEEQKIEIRTSATAVFFKSFEFLQLKDPVTYFELTTLGQNLTAADKEQRWTDIRITQQKILKDKRLQHRNFGTYSKHLCPYDTCPFNGLMVRQGSRLAERAMYFCSDQNSYAQQVKSERRKQERRTTKRIIAEHLDSE